MATTPGSADGTLNGTTPVTLVAAPAGTTGHTARIVRSIIIHNADTAAVTVTIRYVSATGTRKQYTRTLAVAGDFTFGAKGEVIVLDATTKSITAVMSGAPATTQPDFSTSWLDQ